MSGTDGGGSSTPYHSCFDKLTHSALPEDSRFRPLG